jgi:inhibitor of KinA
MDYSRYGEDGVRIIFGNTIDLETNNVIRKFYLFLKSLQRKDIIDIIPSFRSCLIHFNSRRTSYDDLVSFLKDKEEEIASFQVPETRSHEIPVQYGGDASAAYTVFAVGFIPGFPYMGTLDKRIYAPRLETPRLKVPEGSVGLAQLQTGIYSFESPAGWRIIGKTHIQLFDPTKEPYSLLRMGDMVRFIPV